MHGFSIALMIVIYAGLVHHVNVSGKVSILGAVLALIPIFLLVITFALHANSRIKGFGLLAISAVFFWFAWPFVMQHTDYMFWIQDIGLMLILLLTFARTLQKDRKPLCVHFAEIINGDEALPPAHVDYARQVTIAWVVFFAMIILISTLLFFLAPLTIWSIFVNFLTLPLVALMFIVEFMVRRRVLTDLPNGHMLDAVRAYLNNSARIR
ncbi:MAG TPA: hypothetical protein VES38_11720 [Methylotenera sp.]|nr:hypothetical protein [Methylotenera sp.]